MSTEPVQPDRSFELRQRDVEALFEGIDDAVFLHDLDGRILDINSAASRRLGYSRDELLSMTTSDIDDPQFASGFGDRVQEQLSLGRFSCEGCHVTKDGRHIPVDINTSVIRMDGKPAILAVMRDISARKAAEQRQDAQYAVTQALAEANTLAEAAPKILKEVGQRLGWEAGTFWVVSEAGDRLDCLSAWSTDADDAQALAAASRPLTFARGAGVPGLAWDAGTPLWFSDITKVETSPRAALAARTGARQSFTFPIRGGAEVRAVMGLLGRDVPEPDNDLKAMAVALGRQIGLFIERRRAEKAQHLMQTALIRNEKLASIGLLSAGVAHELNNPLAYVANNLVVLERDVKGLRELLDLYDSIRPRLQSVDPETVQKAEQLAERIDLDYIRGNLDRILTRTREGVERMARIVQGLRSLARTDQPRLEEVRLPELIESSLELIRGRIQRRGIKVELDVRTAPVLRCVSTQIGQVLLNLFVNAVQAIESKPGSESGRITIMAKALESEVLIEVADNGCGIDPRDLPRIFDPFYTSKPVGEGTGLGLSITHTIITGHGGRIDVESQPGAGTCFRIYLPLPRKANA